MAECKIPAGLAVPKGFYTLDKHYLTDQVRRVYTATIDKAYCFQVSSLDRTFFPL